MLALKEARKKTPRTETAQNTNTKHPMVRDHKTNPSVVKINN